MFVSGLTLEKIAEVLCVSLTTIKRDRAKDTKAGLDWDGLRDERGRKDPRLLIALLEQRLHKVAADGEMDAGKWADIVQKVSNVLHRERERIGDLSTVLGVFGELAEWAAANVSDEDLVALHRVTEGYLAYLKEAHS